MVPPMIDGSQGDFSDGSTDEVGVKTPSLPPSPYGEKERLRIFERLLGPLRPGRLIDLATGHGQFALIAQRLGWQVTAVDARTERMPFVDGIEWVCADVRGFPLAGFDVITMLGILYHLELPDILDLLRRAAGTTTLIDSHFAVNPSIVEGGYEGKFYRERPSLASSVGNETSFWPHQHAFIRMLIDCGFLDIYVLTPPYRHNRTFYVCK
jgi:hypothetical protein